jgi:hypothetical protein
MGSLKSVVMAKKTPALRELSDIAAETYSEEGVPLKFKDADLDTMTISDLALMVINPFGIYSLDTSQKREVQNRIAIRYVSGTMALEYFRKSFASKCLDDASWLLKSPEKHSGNYADYLTFLGNTLKLHNLGILLKSKPGVPKAVSKIVRELGVDFRKAMRGLDSEPNKNSKKTLQRRLEGVRFSYDVWSRPEGSRSDLVMMQERRKRFDRWLSKIAMRAVAAQILFGLYENPATSSSDILEPLKYAIRNTRKVIDVFGQKWIFEGYGVYGLALGASKQSPNQLKAQELAFRPRDRLKLQPFDVHNQYISGEEPGQIQMRYKIPGELIRTVAGKYGLRRVDFPDALIEILVTDSFSFYQGEFGRNLAHYIYEEARQNKVNQLSDDYLDTYEICEAEGDVALAKVDSIVNPDGTFRLDRLQNL